MTSFFNHPEVVAADDAAYRAEVREARTNIARALHEAEEHRLSLAVIEAQERQRQARRRMDVRGPTCGETAAQRQRRMAEADAAFDEERAADAAIKAAQAARDAHKAKMPRRAPSAWTAVIAAMEVHKRVSLAILDEEG